MAVLDTSDPTDAGTDRDSDPVGIVISHDYTGVLKSLATRSQAVMDEDIHLLGFLVRDVIGDVEISHTPANAGRELRHIENLKGGYSAFAVKYAFPG